MSRWKRKMYQSVKSKYYNISRMYNRKRFEWRSHAVIDIFNKQEAQ